MFFGGRGQGGCERRIEVFVKIQKRFFWFFLGGRVGLGGQGRCEGSSEVFVKIQKRLGGGLGRG